MELELRSIFVIRLLNRLLDGSADIGETYFFIFLKYDPQIQGDRHFHYL